MMYEQWELCPCCSAMPQQVKWPFGAAPIRNITYECGGFAQWAYVEENEEGYWSMNPNNGVKCEPQHDSHVIEFKLRTGIIPF